MNMQDRNTQAHVLHPSMADEAQVSKLFRNTYSLLGMTMAFSALVAFVSMSMNLPRPGIIITLVGFYGLLFAISKFRNSGVGLLLTFALTGFMGYTLGPILNHYLALPNGGQLVSMALGMTAMVFFGLSAYAILTRKDFSFLSGFIMAGFVVLLCAIVASFFVQISGLSLAISAGFVLFSSAVILYQTSAIIHGGEDNYIMATVTLFVSIYNLFLSLLQLLGIFSND
ncbi:modulator of FtsH protease [Halopseudomonas yangmingensis]|uniref:Modulator of FtsH protease n=2 Tax=Halopseudomonas yangmingensis TaxID=1720063 RepID=A0A1I4RRW2_9GAMM|nr:modulator of FtsH protease [Halopseudomonas yangmingensis]